MTKLKICPVIMAGGVGTRFWPESREARPKQLLDVMGTGSTLLEGTLSRVAKFAEAEDTLIITNRSHIQLLRTHADHIPLRNIIAEPIGRNTAPCIALAANILHQRYGDEAVMVVLPADHLIRNEEEFTRIIDRGVRLAQATGGLVTLGIHPTRAETGYGYLQLDEEHLPSQRELPEFSEFELRDIFRVKRFAEKPDKETARRFLESGDFLWNSGMFIWSVKSILSAMHQHTEDILEHLGNLPQPESPDFDAKLSDAYSKIRGVSIDYGVMERAKNVFALRAGALGWSDVGSWDEVWRLAEKDLQNNVIETGKNIIARNSKGCLVLSKSDELIVVNGLTDLVIVHSGDAILITNRESAQSVKDVVDYLKRNNRAEYL
ncbi:MAG: mannose-1-phosphate guanylyltransferase [Bacteroidota bacterium]|nr:mannose-1-phosphate guanylyltransferase [Bacteroidota bacterium]MDP4236172.1 mannose-1-phosphate guanylyltransferase [Bacteroidota bacterium]